MNNASSYKIDVITYNSNCIHILYKTSQIESFQSYKILLSLHKIVCGCDLSILKLALAKLILKFV